MLFDLAPHVHVAIHVEAEVTLVMDHLSFVDLDLGSCQALDMLE